MGDTKDTKKRTISNGSGSIKEYQKTIYKHGTGENAGKKIKIQEKRYKVRYRYKDEFGKIKHGRKSNFVSLRDAKVFLNSLAHDISNGDYIHKKDITVSEYTDGWLAEYRTSANRKNTVDWHFYNIEHIKRGLGKIQVQNLLVRDIKRFYNELLNEDNLSSTYISNINRTLKQILDDAVNSDDPCIKKNPCRDTKIKDLIKLIKKNYKSDFEPVVIMQKDLLRVIDHLKDQPGAVSIALAGLMGLRIGEVRGLRWSDIDFENRELTLRYQLTRDCGKDYRLSDLKTEASYATLKISSYVIGLLSNEQQLQKRLAEQYGKEKFALGFVCVHTRNKQFLGLPFAHNYYNELLDKGTNDLNYPEMRFHDLRHSFGSNLLYQCIPLPTVSKLMRHSNVAITSSTYSKSNKAQDDEIFNTVIDNNINNNIAAIKDKDPIEVAPVESSNEGAYSSPRLRKKIFKDQTKAVS